MKGRKRKNLTRPGTLRSARRFGSQIEFFFHAVEETLKNLEEARRLEVRSEATARRRGACEAVARALPRSAQIGAATLFRKRGSPLGDFSLTVCFGFFLGAACRIGNLGGLWK